MATAELTPKAKENLLQRCLEKVDEGKRDMVSGVITIGRALAEVKEALEPGEFVEWVESHCDFSKSLAYGYIKSFQTFGMYGRVENFESTALLVLGSCPKAAAEAKKIADRGKKITHKAAKALVKQIKANEKPNSTATVAPAQGATPSVNPTSEAPAPAVEREPGDDTEAIEAEKRARRESGKETVTGKQRKEAIKAFGIVRRVVAKIGGNELHRDCLDAILATLEGKA